MNTLLNWIYTVLTLSQRLAYYRVVEVLNLLCITQVVPNKYSLRIHTIMCAWLIVLLPYISRYLEMNTSEFRTTWIVMSATGSDIYQHYSVLLFIFRILKFWFLFWSHMDFTINKDYSTVWHNKHIIIKSLVERRSFFSMIFRIWRQSKQK